MYEFNVYRTLLKGWFGFKSEVMQFLDLEARRNDSESESEHDEDEPANGKI